MSARWRSGYLLPLTLVCLLPAARGQGYIAIDGSGSMAGFAAAGPQRLRGIVQRLHALLSSESPTATRVAFLRERREGTQVRNLLDERPLSSIVALIGPPAAGGRGDRVFTLNTPLQWGIAELRARSGGEFVLITDGMETGARQSALVADLAEMAGNGWAIGIAAVRLPFRGPFYPEMDLPVAERLSDIRAALPQGVKWEVYRGACEGSDTCYIFNGERPLLFLMFAKVQEGLDRLFRAARQALAENQLQARLLQVAPFRSVPVAIEVTAQDPARVRELEAKVKLPAIARNEMEFACRVRDQQFPLRIAARPASELSPPQPTVLRTLRSEIVKAPGWVLAPRTRAASGATPYVDFTLRCGSPGWLDVFSPQVAQSGELEIAIEQQWETADSGWWVDWTAPNPWQYPHKVYHLKEVVESIHKRALAPHRESLKRVLRFTSSVRR